MKLFLFLFSFLFIIVAFCNCKYMHQNKDISTKDASLNEITCELTTYGDSLNVYMQLIPSSVKMTKDSLYFNYRVINDSPRNLLIYKFESLNILLDSMPESAHPMCNIYLINEDNKLPLDEMLSMGGPLREIHPRDLPDSYVTLAVGESKEFSRTEYIRKITLNKGSYRLKMKYLPPRNESYKSFFSDFKEKQNKDPKLRDYEMYGYQIESDTCTIKRIDE